MKFSIKIILLLAATFVGAILIYFDNGSLFFGRLINQIFPCELGLVDSFPCYGGYDLVAMGMIFVACILSLLVAVILIIKKIVLSKKQNNNKNMLNDFKQFLLRGNVVDLAVGVVIGAAFGAVVTALVADLLTPLIAAVAKVPDFSGLYFTLNGSKFMFGHFINAVISFVLVAAAVFFFVVKPINMLVNRTKKEAVAEPNTKKCPECLSEIPVNAKRCKYCTQIVA